jgi:NAD(P)-dependent dehydrogenase (short-subunit alcohol dehydrogenase family)
MKSIVVSFLLALSTVSYALSTTGTTGTCNDMNRKRILVTGSNKGIGKAVCARLLTKYQDTHVLLGSRSLERGQEAIQELVEQCGTQVASRLQLVQVDTSNDESVQKAAESIANEPKLYGIINNAGVRTKID